MKIRNMKLRKVCKIVRSFYKWHKDFNRDCDELLALDSIEKIMSQR